MSLNISGSRFVKVYDPSINLSYSDKVLFANLVSSRKTGRVMMDKESGEIAINEMGNKMQERAFSRWTGKFIGNAFEPSKALRNGDEIDIINGWVSAEPYSGKDGKTHFNVVVTITDFEPSVVAEGVE